MLDRHHRRRGRRLALPLVAVLVASALAPTPTVTAQADGVRVVERRGPPKARTIVPGGYRPDIAMPPGALMGRPPKHGTPPIAPGPRRPQNASPPSRTIDPNGPQPDTGVFRYMTSRAVQPNGASRSTTGEPSAAQLHDTAFYTGNWYAALSTNSGYDWEHVSPYSFFPSLDAGFCCDQRVLHVRSKNALVWLLQYGYSFSTGVGSYRLAVAPNRDALRSGDPTQWFTYDFDPTDFGFPTGTWLDFPDLGATDGWLYVTANVFDPAGNYVDAVRWRVDLDDVAAGTPATYWWSTGTQLAPSGFGSVGSLRLADAGDTMFTAGFKNDTTLFIWRTNDVTNVTTRYERAVNNWRNAIATCPGPDGRDWCGSVVGRLRGGFGFDDRVGWIWTSAQDPANGRPRPYARVATFSASSLNKLSDDDVWSTGLAWTFGAGDSNAQSDFGLVFAVGGPNTHVHASCTIIDQYQPSFAGLTGYSQPVGTSGPDQNRWGDYFDVQRHPTSPLTFVATGMRQSGGAGDSWNEPRWVWFGRDDYDPGFVGLSVQSTGPTNGVPITVDVRDVQGDQNGATPFTRSYAPRQGYVLTAPATYRSRTGDEWVFLEWAHAITPTTPPSSRGPSEILTIDDIGYSDDRAIARYVRRRTLSVESTNPATGVPVTVSVTDLNRRSNGSTQFTRDYRDGTVVQLTAPRTFSFNPFVRWVIDRVPQPAGRNLVAVTMSRDVTARAEYRLNVAGTVDPLGAGCPGSSGAVPNHTITWPAGQQGPQQGTVTSYRLAGARASSVGALHLGIDATQWNGFPLPLDLTFLGMAGCFVHHSLNVSPAIATSSRGTSVVSITYPVDPTLIGSHVYSTFAVVDPGANGLGVVHSNALDLAQGGTP